MIKNHYNCPDKLDKIALSIPIVFFFIYSLLPVKVSSIDGYGFGVLIKNGQDLFLAHHLLYNFFGFLWSRVATWVWDFETLAALKVMNSFATGISLFLLNRILKRIEVLPLSRILWLIFVGASWGVMRFSTENESYILPICFSLLGSLLFLKYLSEDNKKFLLLSGFFSSFAALIHQIHFFWWLGLLFMVFLKKQYFKDAVIFFLPALLVPFVYFLVFVFYQGNAFSVFAFFEFIFSDYQSGTAEFSIDFRNFLLTPVSFIRSFVQVHGYMYHLSMSNLIFVAVLLISFFCFFKSMLELKNVTISYNRMKSTFVLVHFFAFILHFVFAFLSHGNAEFMVMIPFLVAIILSSALINYSRLLLYFSVGLFFWNISFGLIPLSRQGINGDQMVADFIVSKNNSGSKNEDLYILFNRPRVGNMVEYFNNSINKDNMFFIEEFDAQNEIVDFVRQELTSGKSIYTDCVDRPFTVSRASLLIDSNQDAFSSFKNEKVDSASSLSGVYYLTKISCPEE